MANMIQNAAASTQAVAKSKKPSSIQDSIEVTPKKDFMIVTGRTAHSSV